MDLYLEIANRRSQQDQRGNKTGDRNGADDEPDAGHRDTHPVRTFKGWQRQDENASQRSGRGQRVVAQSKQRDRQQRHPY